MSGVKLYVERSVFPEPDDGEFYHADLIGLNAETEDGAALGRVVSVYNFGAGDILEINAKNNDKLLIPFTNAAVPVVDIAKKRVVVVLPDEVAGEEKPEAEEAL